MIYFEDVPNISWPIKSQWAELTFGSYPDKFVCTVRSWFEVAVEVDLWKYPNFAVKWKCDSC